MAIISVTVLGLSFGLTPALAWGGGGSWGGHSQATVYNNIPDQVPGNVPSVGFEATSASEYGSQVQLDGSARKDPKVTVLMSSWACKSGTWNGGNCITNPGSTFTHPVTVNVYDVNDDDSAGALLASKTETFTMPYRPTADDGTNCNGANAGKWWDGTNCNNGKAFPISFDLDGTTLPDNVIIGVAYDTSNHGANPLGTGTACYGTPQGCPYDSLNVGTNPTPTVGSSEPSNDDAYYDTSVAGFYCDNGAAGTDTFRLDAGCWTGYLPAIKVAATGNSGKPHHDHGHHDRGHHYGYDKEKHQRFGDSKHGFYNLWNR
jgi:hypothetical protein